MSSVLLTSALVWALGNATLALLPVIGESPRVSISQSDVHFRLALEAVRAVSSSVVLLLDVTRQPLQSHHQFPRHIFRLGLKAIWGR